MLIGGGFGSSLAQLQRVGFTHDCSPAAEDCIYKWRKRCRKQRRGVKLHYSRVRNPEELLSTADAHQWLSSRASPDLGCRAAEPLVALVVLDSSRNQRMQRAAPVQLARMMPSLPGEAVRRATDHAWHALHPSAMSEQGA